MDRSAVNSIKTPMLKAYLSRSGWKKAEYKRDSIAKYEYLADKQISVLVPEREGTRDFAEAIDKVVSILSQVELRSKESVEKAILFPNQDELRLQFGGASAKPGSLPLDYMISATKSIQDSIIYSACGEVQPKAYYQRKLKEAIRRTKDVRFGQTQVGSFVMSIEFPFDPPVRNSLQLTDPEPPFGRRVFERIIRGVEKATKVTEDNEQIDLEEEFKSGLNANLAESLAGLSDAGLGIEVTLSCSWSSSLGAPSGLTNVPLTLDATAFSSLKSIGKSLRSPAISKDAVVEGLIATLSRDDSAEVDDEIDDSIDRTIVIRIDDPEDLPTKSVRVSLSSADYARACDAHRDRKRVSVRGKLEKLGKWHISNYSEFIVK